jgi:uncharacterized damage-inducible protein DinB
MSIDDVREHLARALDWDEAHAGFEKSLTGIPPNRRGDAAQGFEHSLWQLLEHLRIALDDLIDFAVNPQYAHTRNWPQDYWPKPAVPTEAEWQVTLSAFRAGLARLQAIARDGSVDLLAPVPTGKPSQTHLRNILLAIDHNAYHLGQIVAVRRALGIWP